jgi:hypothetical protein
MVGNGAFIAIYDAGAQHSEFQQPKKYPRAARDTLEFTAPGDEGHYELRLYRQDNLYSAQTHVLSVPFVVVREAPASLESASDWARDAIRAAIGKGFVPADIQNNYRNVITRAEFCRMAVKWVEYVTGKSIDAVLTEKGLTRTNPFTDTNDPDIIAAFALGITSGTSATTFNPSGQFSREQAATMIMNSCRAIGANVSNPRAFGFADIGSAASWAVSGINFVGTNGIMHGTGHNNFSPKANYTREMSIVTFDRINPNTLPGR